MIPTMFCPDCGAEYRQGFDRCTDCDVPLVEQLPASNESADSGANGVEFRALWTGEDEQDCECFCDRLRKAGIPFKIAQRAEQASKNEVVRTFKIDVPREFQEAASKMVGEGRMDFADSEEDQRIMELPAQDGPDTARHSYVGKVALGQTADVQVWSGNYAGLLELCLRENDIKTRVDVSPDGTGTICVAAQDESKAREIIHEVEEGIPPE